VVIGASAKPTLTALVSDSAMKVTP